MKELKRVSPFQAGLGPTLPAFILAGLAMAGPTLAQTQDVDPVAVLNTLSSGAGDDLRWTVAPTYSEVFGLGLRLSAGGYATDSLALGAIVEYGENREEYLVNAGVQISDRLSMIGTVGLLKENTVFALGDGRLPASQYQYALSLRGRYTAGILRGFEVNTYMTDASATSDSVETGDMSGLQLVSVIPPTNGSILRVGGGYERIEWDGGDVAEGATAQITGSSRLTDRLALTYESRLSESETLAGAGLRWDLSPDAVTSRSFAVDYTYIEGRHGIADDQRVSLNWTFGKRRGDGGVAVADAGAQDGGASNRTLGSSAARSGDLLGSVMQRPAFLPARVIARASGDGGGGGGGGGTCPQIVRMPYNDAQPDDSVVYEDTYAQANGNGPAVIVYFAAPEGSWLNDNWNNLDDTSYWTLEGAAPYAVGGSNVGGDGANFIAVKVPNWNAVDVGGDTGTKTLTLNYDGVSCTWTVSLQSPWAPPP